jgi:hypothetical protein
MPDVFKKAIWAVFLNTSNIKNIFSILFVVD